LGDAVEITGWSVTLSLAGGTPGVSGVGDSGGMMIFDGTYCHDNLNTKGYPVTFGAPQRPWSMCGTEQPGLHCSSLTPAIRTSNQRPPEPQFAAGALEAG
jgi:hypothetical protein